MKESFLKDEARYIIDLVKKICTKVGPGIPCSPQEKDRAMIIREELEKTVGPESVDVEEFTCAPYAFLGWIRFGAIAGAISVGLHFLARQTTGYPVIPLYTLSFLFALAILLAFVFQFILCREFLDFLFPKKNSLNVIGKIPPKEGPVKKILIFAGHHDSAYQFNWVRYLKYGYFLAVAVIFWGVISIALNTGFSLAGFIFDSERLIDLGQITLRNLYLPVIPALVFAFFFLGSGKNGGTVPGAADNLSGSALAISVGRILKQNPEIIPPHTEIRLISFGSEEAGMRGSLRYVEKHLGELKEHDAELCNFETVICPVITILTSDCNGFVRNSRHVVDALAEAARRAEVPHRIKPFPFGGAGTDASPFSAAGIKASCLLPLKYPGQMVKFYHQPSDNYDILTPEPLINTLKIAIEWIKGTPA